MFCIKPVMCAACGAALSYYCLFPQYRSGVISIDGLLALVFIPAAFLCLLRALASLAILPAEEEKESHNSLYCRELSLKRTRNLQINRHSPRLRVMSFGAAAFAAGLAIGIAAGAYGSDTVYFGIPEKNIRKISGTLLDDPRVVSGGRAMSMLSLKTADNGRARAASHGQITVFFREENADRLKEFGRGTEILAEGNIRSPGTGTAAGFNSGAYTFSADALHITKAAPSLERFRTGLRIGLTERFTGSPRTGAWAGLALALLLGIRDNLDTGFTAQYRNAGCSYILALSGMHLAILVSLLSFLLQKPLGFRTAAVTGAVIITAYCFIVGPLPSLNRAALMYLLGVVSALGMLKRDMLSLLCMAFLLQIMGTPRSGYSLSFILSYLALAGILVIGRGINSALTGKIPPVLLRPFSASVGAFIATAGVTAWFFSDLRPVGILAGLILAPLAAVFMVLSVAWLGLDFIVSPLSFLLGKTLSFLYWLMEKISALSAAVPGVRANPFLVLFLSLLITVPILLLDRRRRITATGDGADILEPFV
jgi:competence protein ComEC